MMTNLLKERQVDLMLGYPSGRTKRLALKGKIPYITLPDGSMRFDEQVIEELIHPEKPKYANDDLQRRHSAVENSKEIYNAVSKLSKTKDQS